MRRDSVPSRMQAVPGGGRPPLREPGPWRAGAVVGRAAVALLLPLLAGCAVLDLRAPSVALVDLELEQLGLLESTVLVTLRVENPNSFRLPIAHGAYTFFLAGERVGVGATRRPVDVPARGFSRQQVAIELDNARLLRRLRELLRREVSYRVEAEHLVRVPGLGERPVRSIGEGQLDLSSARRAAY